MHQKSNNLLKALLATSALAWINALISLWHRQNILMNGLKEVSFCKIGSAFDCDATALSSYSSIFGMPTSALGMVAYTFFILLALNIFFSLTDGNEEKSRASAKVLAITSLLGLIPTLFLALNSFLVIKTICLMCLAAYFLNLGLAVFSFLLYKSLDPKKEKFSLKLGTPFWIVFGVLAALQLLGPTIIDKNISQGPGMDSAMEDLFLNDHLSGKVNNFTTEGAATQGPADAHITVVEFSDMQCPACARSALTLPPILKNYPSSVRLVYKNFPLDSGCNSGIKSAMHPYACLAAKTGFCILKAKGSETFFQFKHAMFVAQSKMNAEMIKNEALNLGLDVTALDSCVNDPQTHQAIVDQINGGLNAKVESTPSIYVNGRHLQSGPQPKVFKKVLDYYLQNK